MHPFTHVFFVSGQTQATSPGFPSTSDNLGAVYSKAESYFKDVLHHETPRMCVVVVMAWVNLYLFAGRSINPPHSIYLKGPL